MLQKGPCKLEDGARSRLQISCWFPWWILPTWGIVATYWRGLGL